jgi:hypothetical protein
MGVFSGYFSRSRVFPHLHCERIGLIEINVTLPWLASLRSFSLTSVACICVSFLLLYSLLLQGVLQICERYLKTAFWRLVVYIPFALGFLLCFALALFLFPQEKVLVIALFFSYNLLKIGYGAYKSSIPNRID